MPIIKSARKRVKVAKKAAVRNSKTKRSLREALKTFAKLLESGKPAEVQKAQAAAVSAIDRAAKKNVIHKNKAARAKASLAAQAKKAGVKAAKAKSSKPKAQSSPTRSAAKKPSPAKLSPKVQAGKAKKASK